MKDFNIFNVSKHIINTLSADETLQECQISTIDADEGTKFPFITVVKDNASETRNKSYINGYSCTVSLYIYSTTYDQGVELAIKAYEAMQNNFGPTTAVLTNATESYDDDIYVQMLTFTFNL